MRDKTRDKTRVMKNDQVQVLPLMDTLEWPIALGELPDYDTPVIYCGRFRCGTLFTDPETPRGLLTQIAIHAAECKGVIHADVG